MVKYKIYILKFFPEIYIEKNNIRYEKNKEFLMKEVLGIEHL